MQTMDHAEDENTESDYPEIIKAELVEEIPGSAWQWREVRPVPPPSPPQRRRWRLAVLLFAATCLSTLMAGMSDADGDTQGWFAVFLHGLRYAVPVMTILVCHEMGHFLQARRYGVRTSPPFFIPMPFSPLGTLGAVIAMEPRIGHRRALFDIGVTGPLAGLVPTMIFLVAGLHRSEIVVPHKIDLVVGSPLLFDYLARAIVGPIPPGMAMQIDPMAFAGWVGLLITSLNLIPIGQLDGGHVLYALLREKAHAVASFLLFAAVMLVAMNWRELYGWFVMLELLILMGPRHPPTADDREPLDAGRTVLGWLTLAFIVVGFTPTPLRFVP